MSYRSTNGTTHLALVSGAKGSIIGMPMELPSCSDSAKVFVQNNGSYTEIVFFCAEFYQNGNLWSMSGTALCQLALNSQAPVPSLQHIVNVAPNTSKVLLQPISKLQGLIAAWADGGSVLVVGYHSQQQWKVMLNSGSNIRAIAVGSFLDSLHEEVLLSMDNHDHRPILTIMSAASGKVLSTIKQESFNIASLLTIPHSCQEKDSIILKSVSSKTAHNSNETVTINEEYRMLDCAFNSRTHLILSNSVTVTCRRTHCDPDAYASKGTAALSLRQTGTDLVVVSVSAAVPSNGTVEARPEDIAVTVVKKRVFTGSRCCKS